MLPNQSWNDRQFIVWGLGKTGTAMARFLGRAGAQVHVVDRAAGPSEATRDALRDLPITYHWGGDAPPLDSAGLEAIILSPGVPYDLPPLVAARDAGIKTIAAMQWAADKIDLPLVAVTGTAGKSTTVSLLGAMLSASGKRPFVGGNLGTPLVSILGLSAEGAGYCVEGDYDILVLECSSFQLEATDDLGADVAVLTNISDNHLDRHGTMEAYSRCKARLFAPLSPESYAITQADDPACLAIVASAAKQALLYADEAEAQGRPGAALTDEGFCLRLPAQPDEVETYRWDGFRLRGKHNYTNAMTAALAARLAGATPAGIRKAMDDFAPLAHRLEEVDAPGPLHFFNDSKSTTPESTAKAISAFDPAREPVHLLLGGRAKGTPFAPLIPLLKAGTKAVYLFGEAAEEIGAALQPEISFTSHRRMEDALESATQAAEPGENIVLSPACASFDQFANFEARGDAFKAWVRAHVEVRMEPTTTDREGQPS